MAALTVDASLVTSKTALMVAHYTWLSRRLIELSWLVDFADGGPVGCAIVG